MDEFGDAPATLVRAAITRADEMDPKGKWQRKRRRALILTLIKSADFAAEVAADAARSEADQAELAAARAKREAHDRDEAKRRQADQDAAERELREAAELIAAAPALDLRAALEVAAEDLGDRAVRRLSADRERGATDVEIASSPLFRAAVAAGLRALLRVEGVA